MEKIMKKLLVAFIALMSMREIALADGEWTENYPEYVAVPASVAECLEPIHPSRCDRNVPYGEDETNLAGSTGGSEGGDGSSSSGGY
jgi:hypothetical protein